VVRFDSSGTTQIFKNYLKNADSARTGSVCEGTNVAGGPNPWDTFALNANNRSWPGTLTDPAPLGTCTSLVTGGANGNGPEITKVKATPGGIGYADLADAVAGQVAPIPYQIASVRNATDTLFVAPRSGRAANCNLGVASLPGSSNADAVGLNTTGDTWALDNAPNHGDATGAGSAYPICGLTWALVYSGLADGSVNNLANPITRLSQNQRRTLYSYESYILSSAAQDRLSSAFYISLPPAWLVKLRGGFQAAY
jgi:ABC-type phosphate transport system substrate-binding protein